MSEAPLGSEPQPVETIEPEALAAAADLAVPAPMASGAALARIERLTERAREHVDHSKAANTRRAYRSDWADFAAWCRHHGVADLPASADTVALYLTDCAEGLKTSTLQRRLASISQAHQAAGHETPTRHALVRAVWQGIRREKGTAVSDCPLKETACP